MKKSGFTLIEILAVIVILAIIALIAFPLLLGVLDESKRSSFLRSVEQAIDSVDYYLIDNNLPINGVSASELSIKNKTQFTSGKIIENGSGNYEARFLSNGTYCVSGEKGKLKIAKTCGDFDKTDPIVSLSVVSKTTNKIVVEASAFDSESGISKYEFAIDSGSYINNNENSSYTYNSVTTGTHTLKVRVTNGVGTVVEKNISTNPNDIVNPTYSISPLGYATSKNITITYPTRETGFIYTYSVDSGTTWTIVTPGTTANVLFTSNGSVIARVYDGTNYNTASTYTVSGIDTTVPISSLSITSRTTNKIVVTATASDAESNITKYEFAIDSDIYIDNGLTSTYTYNSVTSGNHTLKVRVTNGSGLTTITNILGVPNDITTPIYSISPSEISYATSKTVTITYPTRETGFIYTYSINSGSTWTTVATGVTATIPFTANGSVIARIYDGTNYKTASTYTVSGIDTTYPSLPTISSINNPHYDSIIATFTSSVDAESGISVYRCVFGESPSNLNLTGTISGNTCTMTPIHTVNWANSPYYFKVCAKNNAGLESCSTIYGPVASSYCASYYHGFNENYSACVGGTRTYNKYYLSNVNNVYICAIASASEAC